MFLLDTNVVSELRKAGDGSANENVTGWLSASDPTTFYISPITLQEIEVGILRIERRDVAKGALLRRWMNDHIIPEFSERTLPIDAAIAFRCASLHVPITRPDNDAWIAATALVHNMTVVTRNTVDFEPTGVRLLNPWDTHHHP
jgi:predicted nucleic acid-binding protein